MQPTRLSIQAPKGVADVVSSGCDGLAKTQTPPPPVALLQRSPGLLLGPYYPLVPCADADDRLWRGHELPATVRALCLQGRVVDQAGRAVPGATVELWHADPAGRYRHPSAPGSAQVFDGFTGYGRVATDDEGRFMFASLVPGAYADGGVQRTPHLHLQISGRFDRLVTQLFLPGHPGNADDRWYRAVRQPERLTAELRADDATGLCLHWTAVLAQG